MISVLEECHCTRLRAFLSFDYVELDLIAIFECFVPIQLDCRVVDEYIRPVFASDESVALGVVKLLNNSASSAESVGGFRFGQSSKCVIEGHFHRFEGTKAVGPSGYHSNLVVETLDCAA